MFSLFQRKRPPVAPAPSPAPATDLPKGLMRPQAAASLLDTPRRQKLLEHIWQRTSLSRKQFATLYRTPLERYAELVQQFPASESHHHAYPGGMLDHGLEIVAYSLKLRQSHLLPIGATPEDQAAQAEAWTAAVAYAALLHDIGKVAVDLHVELVDGSTWHPWHGPLRQPYRFRYNPDREYRLHSAATGLLYRQLLDRDLLDWLSSYPRLWASLLYVLAGQYEHAGVLGELVVQADRASVAQELGGNPARAMAAPKHTLQRKLVKGLRYLLKEELKLNQPEASDGWLTEDALWLVSKTVSDKLRAHLLSLGVDGIPTNNTAVFNVLQDHGVLQTTPDGKAIWRATITSPSGWSYPFTLLRLAPALIWQPNERPPSFRGSVTVEEATTTEEPTRIVEEHLCLSEAVPATMPPLVQYQTTSSSDIPCIADSSENIISLLDTPTLPDTGALPADEVDADTQQHSLLRTPALPCESCEEPENQAQHPSGEHFLTWLRIGILSRRLKLNDPKALVHTVGDMVFLVSPGIFQRYAQEHLQVDVIAKKMKLQGWQWVQKLFEKLEVHRKQQNGMNIWTCDVVGPRRSRRLHGYLLNDHLRILEEMLPNNPHLKIEFGDRQVAIDGGNTAP
ncbi:TPA: MobH family relaxase [Pseudomonas aeruginosa]